jgi:hypothetical protein
MGPHKIWVEPDIGSFDSVAISFCQRADAPAEKVLVNAKLQKQKVFQIVLSFSQTPLQSLQLHI